jgi:L-asparaginase
MQVSGEIKRKKIVILGTGGTIAGTAAQAGDNLGYTAAQVGVQQLVAALPVPAGDGCELFSEQVAQVDSKDMAFSIWRVLAQRVAHWLAQDEVQGIVITHGTDTLAPDGPQNMLDAVAVASQAGARGVVAVCAGVIHSAADVQKVHTYRLDAFSSGDAGPLGYVEEGCLRLLRNWPSAHIGKGEAAMKTIASDALDRAWPRVDIVLNYAGADGRAVRALVADGVEGLVVAGTGNGSLHHALEAALLEAQAGGVQVVRSTRCLDGRVLPHAGDVLADSQGLSPVKARVALMLALLASGN